MVTFMVNSDRIYLEFKSVQYKTKNQINWYVKQVSEFKELNIYISRDGVTYHYKQLLQSRDDIPIPLLEMLNSKFTVLGEDEEDEENDGMQTKRQVDKLQIQVQDILVDKGL